MKELKTLRIDSDVQHFIECYDHNKELVGNISVRLDVYGNFIKILSIFPLKDKKLEYFLKLDPKSKCGYMSKYIMTVAKKMNIPNSIIEQYGKLKKTKRIYKNILSAKEIGQMFTDDFKKGLIEYKSVIKSEVYTEELSKQTQNLCSAIFEQFDKARLKMLEEQQL
jgi:hypothetical protein